MLIHCKKADWTVTGPHRRDDEWYCVATTTYARFELVFDYNPEWDVIAGRVEEKDLLLADGYKRFDVFEPGNEPDSWIND